MSTPEETRLDARFDKMSDAFANSIRLGDEMLCTKMKNIREQLADLSEFQDHALKAVVKEHCDLRHTDIIRTASQLREASRTAATQAKEFRTPLATVVARVDALHVDVREMRHLLKRAREMHSGDAVAGQADAYSRRTRTSIQDCRDALATQSDVVAELRRNVALMQATMWTTCFVGVVVVAYYFYNLKPKT
jgi:methyl-accepting chemotaxis protein